MTTNHYANGSDLASVRGWIKGAKLVLSLLQHAEAHLEEVAEDQEDAPSTVVPGQPATPEPVHAPEPPAAPEPEPAQEPPSQPVQPEDPTLPHRIGDPEPVTPQQRARAAMNAAGYGPQAEARQPRGRTFVTPGLRQAIVDAARRRPKPTIAVLANEFDVSTATVSRIMRQRYEKQEQDQWEGAAAPK